MLAIGRTLCLTLVEAVAACSASSSPDGVSSASELRGAPCERDLTVWPNCASAANSDPWLVAHHDTVTRLRPRVLVLNFDNDTLAGNSEAPRNRAQELVRALATASTYHGQGTPFLQYDVVDVVDMTDGAPDGNGDLHNSTWLPRRPHATCAGTEHDKTCRPSTIAYASLLEQRYTDRFGQKDPRAPSRNMSLCEMFQRGAVHEVWIYADASASPRPDALIDEMLELKQTYHAANLSAVPGVFEPAAGNGKFSPDDVAALQTCGVTMRFVGLMPGRGIGCELHAIGHGIEGEVLRAPVPYLARNARHFMNFDLDTRLGMSIDRFYACPNDGKDCISYVGTDGFHWIGPGGEQTVPEYDQGCGSVHFPPNARRHYDYDNQDDVVFETCPYYGMHNREDGSGQDGQEAYGPGLIAGLRGVAPDCGGPWVAYWMRSMPGYANSGKDSDDEPMKSWWPFLFY
jgi:hypothetical protein